MKDFGEIERYLSFHPKLFVNQYASQSLNARSDDTYWKVPKRNFETTSHKFLAILVFYVKVIGT